MPGQDERVREDLECIAWVRVREVARVQGSCMALAIARIIRSRLRASLSLHVYVRNRAGIQMYAVVAAVEVDALHVLIVVQLQYFLNQFLLILESSRVLAPKLIQKLDQDCMHTETWRMQTILRN